MSIYDWSDPSAGEDEGPPDQPPVGAEGPVPSDEGGVTIVRGERRPSLRTGKRIPQNVLDAIRNASRQTGVPEWVLIAVLQQENPSYNVKAVNSNADGSRDYGLTQINDRARLTDFGGDRQELVACAQDVTCSITYLAQSTRGVYRNEPPQTRPADPGSREEREGRGTVPDPDAMWLNAAANWHRSVRDQEWSTYRQRLSDLVERGYVPTGKKPIAGPTERKPTAAEKRLLAPATMQDIYDLFEEFLGRSPKDDAEAQGYGRVGVAYGTLRAEFAASPEAGLWRRYASRIRDARSWANTLWRDYLGHQPTNEELRAVIDNRWDQDRTEAWLRAQPYGGTSLGQIYDVRRLADRYALQYVGRSKADEGEVNWLVEKGKISAEDISAFYEQLKGRRDTGDPTFAWVGDPTAWRQMRDQLGQMWTRAGLKGPPDPRLVNQAVSDNWSLADIRDAINALPAPGFQGVSVGEVNRVRDIAGKWKEQYLPGQPLTHDEMARFVAMSSDEVRTYYRSLPVSMRREALAYASTKQATPTTTPPSPAPASAAVGPPPSQLPAQAPPVAPPPAGPVQQPRPSPRYQTEGAPPPVATEETREFWRKRGITVP